MWTGCADLASPTPVLFCDHRLRGIQANNTLFSSDSGAWVGVFSPAVPGLWYLHQKYTEGFSGIVHCWRLALGGLGWVSKWLSTVPSLIWTRWLRLLLLEVQYRCSDTLLRISCCWWVHSNILWSQILLFGCLPPFRQGGFSYWRIWQCLLVMVQLRPLELRFYFLSLFLSGVQLAHLQLC